MNTSSKSTSTKYYTFKTKTNIKNYPHTNSRNAKLKATGTITVLGTVSSGSWYKVKTGDVVGYVPKSSLNGPLTKTAAASKLAVSVSGFKVQEGKTHAISGKVTSNYAISKITGSVGNQTQTITTKEFGSGKKSVSIQNTLINKNLKCGKLTAGTHTLKLTAWDSSGKKASATATITVDGSVKAPVIGGVRDVAGGKTVTITQKQSGATLYYQIGKQAAKSTTNGSVTTATIGTEGTTTIKAWSKKSGSSSATVTYNVNVPKLGVPEVNDVQEGREAKVILRSVSGAKISYRIGSGSYMDYKGEALYLQDKTELSYYAKKAGCINSSVGTYTVELAEPGTPDVKLTNGDGAVATGKTAVFSWSQDRRATSYTVILYRASDDSVVEEITTEKNTASFTLDTAGGYYVTVKASNDIGDSEESGKASVEAKDPLTVVFRDADDGDEEGVVLNTLKVEYGTKISSVDAPSRKGHDFKGWMNEADESVSLNAYTKSTVREDMTYVAVYEKKRYEVKLYDTEGKLMATKTVKYGEATDTEEETAQIESGLEDGYIFAGWQVTGTTEGDSAADIGCVDSNMEAHAVVSWAEPDLPVRISFSKEPSQVTRSNTEYIEAEVALNNDKSRELSMYLICALKAGDEDSGVEKTVYVDRKIVELPEGSGTDDPERVVSLRMKPSDIQGINKLEVTAVQMNADMTTGSAYSRSKTAAVTIISDWDAWSEWTTTPYTGNDDREVEHKTVYRYRDKSYTYNGADSLSGYTKESTQYYNFSNSSWQSGSYTKYGNYVMNAPEKSTNVTSSYKDVNSYTTTTAQRSYAYVSGKKDWYWTNTGGVSSSGQKTSNLLTVYSSTSLKKSGYSKDTDGSYALPKTISTSSPGKMGTIYRIDYAGTLRANTFTSGIKNTWLWPHSSSTRTLYRGTTVRTRNKYWKWGNWSAWSDTKYTATNTRAVETRTMYRYRDRLTEDKPDIQLDPNGEFTRHVEGAVNVETDLNGKVATIMVYQSHNTDPNKYQMQYMGQTVIGEGNSYSFDFIPREEPTVESGNYIVALGVQGTTGMIRAERVSDQKNGENDRGLVLAPRAEYRVNLFYKDGEDTVYIARDIAVKDHDDVDLSGIEIPKREGYVFLGWKNRTTDITSDCVTDGVCNIEAAYAPLQNAVVFVDWINQELEIQNAATGDMVDVPAELGETEGYIFKGWRLEDGTVLTVDPDSEEPTRVRVTGNMVITAEYAPIEYEVTFLGVDGETVATQTVAYGSSAEPPAYTVPGGKGVFAGWSTDVNWWNVYEDVTVRAVVVYDEQALAPTSRLVIDETSEARSVVLETEEEDAAIYYTTDGTMPTAELIEEYLQTDEDNYKGSIKEYKEPIVFIETEGDDGETQEEMDIISVAYVAGKNVSEECNTFFEKEPEEDVNHEPETDWTEIGEYEVKAKAGKNVQITVDLEENPGLTGYDFLIESDKDVFYMDDDEYGAPEVTGGAVSTNGTMITSDLENGWRINWNSVETSSVKGNLFKMILRVDEEAEGGTYPITISYAPEGTLDENFDVTELNGVKVTIDSEASIKLDPDQISLSRTSYVYEGEAFEPSVKIGELKEGTDFTVAYRDNINAGTATAVITGTGDYAGTVEKEFTIAQANIANAEIAAVADAVKTGEAIEPELDITFNGKTLEKGSDYEVTYDNNIEVGTAAANVKGIGNFRGTTAAGFNITETLESRLAQAEKKLEESEKAAKEAADRIEELRKALEDAEQRAQNARGELKAVETELANAIAEKKAAEADAAISEAARQAAQARVDELIRAKENAEAELGEANRAKQELQSRLGQAEQEKREAAEQAAQLAGEKAELEKRLEEAGEATGRQGGSNEAVSITKADVGGIEEKVYTGKPVGQTPVVAVGGTVLIDGIDYSISYTDNTDVGTATMLITGIGNYTGTITETFPINPKGTKITKAVKGKKKVTVKWKKQRRQTTGYQIRYGLKKDLTGKVKTVTVRKAKTTKKVIRKLKSGKTYYLQIRTYRKIGKQYYFSPWSGAKAVKVK